MNIHKFLFQGAGLSALPTGALFWRDESLLVVSDLHLGKAARFAQQGGAMLPPYDARDTLQRLANDLQATHAKRVICLGDSFDSPELGLALPKEDRLWITSLQAGRDWTWIEGNHDPGPVDLGGGHLAELSVGPLVFRHIAEPHSSGEVSGHYHPKASLSVRGRTLTRPCFLVDSDRLILPAYGTYTGGLRCTSPTLANLMATDAQAILIGPSPIAIPMPRTRGGG